MAPLHLARESKEQNPHAELMQFEKHVDALYKHIQDSPADKLEIGLPSEFREFLPEVLSSNRYIIAGVELGDEGKGRLIDNIMQFISRNDKIKAIVVDRFQGGSNAGHTIEKDGVKLAMHQVPSIAFEPKAIGIMDRGMVIHVEDLQTEVTYIEEAIGENALKDRLFLSPDAILLTDIERALEILDREKTEGAAGGTGRGIGPAYAGRSNKTALTIADLLNDNWKETLGNHYDWTQQTYTGHHKKLADQKVPDFRTGFYQKAALTRTVGSKDEFLSRIEKSRAWLLSRDMVPESMYPLHEYIKDNSDTIAFTAETAQAIGLSIIDGTLPDTTASDTSVYGIKAGTKSAWLPEDFPVRIGVWKGTYMSSVGARRMPTHIDVPKTVFSPKDLPPGASRDQKRAARIRDAAHEYGTTTMRPRDICHTDLVFLKYNAEKGGINMLAATHMDIAQEGEKILLCTHYTRGGQLVPYEPGLSYQKGVTPHYKEFDGWSGDEAQNATSFDELPVNAKKWLAFIQAYLGKPVVMVTTGPERSNIIEFPQFESASHADTERLRYYSTSSTTSIRLN